jgi:preprotein translocase subunit SecE
MARISPVEFFDQVKTETKKIVWPSRRETVMTGVMVLLMTTMLGIFFIGIDTMFDVLVRFLLSLAQ